MWQNQLRRIVDFLPEHDQIQIERRAVQNFFGPAAKLNFQPAQFFKQRFRRFIGGRENQRRRSRTLANPAGNPPARFATTRFQNRRIGKILQPRQGIQNNLPRIAQV